MLAAETIRFTPPRNIEQAYTEGDCWHFAETIHRLTGLPIVSAQWDEKSMPVHIPSTGEWLHPTYSYWAHIANRLPDGRIIDIQGIWLEEEWLEHWHNIAYVYRINKENRIMFLKEWTREEWATEAEDAVLCLSFPEVENLTEEYAKEVLSHI